MTTEINDQDNKPVENQEEKTVEAPAAGPVETETAQTTPEPAVSPETSKIPETEETSQASGTEDTPKTPDTAETSESKPDIAAESKPEKAAESKPETAPGKKHEGAYVRRTGSEGEQRRERPQGEGYQRRDSSQRFSKFRRKVCYFCANKDAKIDYKNADTLGRFITDRGKILPRRVTGVCARHQRGLAKAIKKARIIALIPFIEK